MSVTDDDSEEARQARILAEVPPLPPGPPMLHAARARQKANVEAEAAGVNLWTKKFSERVRKRVLTALDRSFDHWQLARVYSDAIATVEEQEGRGCFRSNFEQALLHDPDEMTPTLIEALVWTDTVRFQSGGTSFVARLQAILREERLGFDLIEGQMIEFESREMHQAVVGPALNLLAGRPDLASVERSYQEALHELSAGNYGDSVNDATRALEETFQALGAGGNSLRDRFKKAHQAGLLAAYDERLVDAIDQLTRWTTADRGDKGDAHPNPTANRDDAWFTIHVVGALILRLSAGTGRA